MEGCGVLDQHRLGYENVAARLGLKDVILYVFMQAFCRARMELLEWTFGACVFRPFSLDY